MKSFVFLVEVSDDSQLRAQDDLSLVLEDDLHDLIAEPEHNSMLCSHPFLHVNVRQVFR